MSSPQNTFSLCLRKTLVFLGLKANTNFDFCKQVIFFMCNSNASHLKIQTTIALVCGLSFWVGYPDRLLVNSDADEAL